MDLGSLQPAEGSRRNTKRLGRGNGSGHGTTAGRGSKGQRARSGHKRRPWFEGGQMPLQRRLPKRGFNRKFRVENQVVNLSDLQRLDEKEITPEVLAERGMINPRKGPVKILGDGDAPEKVKVTAHKFSKSAEEKITAAGGSVERL